MPITKELAWLAEQAGLDVQKFATDKQVAGALLPRVVLPKPGQLTPCELLVCCLMAVLDNPTNPAAWAELLSRTARISGVPLAELQPKGEAIRLAVAASKKE